MRTSLALALGRDLLLATAVCAVAILVTLTLQLRVGERELRQRSLAEAVHYVEQHIAAGPNGELRLPAAPGSSWSSFGYPTMVFAADGQLLYSRPAARFLDPPLVAALANQRLPAPKAAGGVRLFNLNLGSQRIIGAVLHSNAPGRAWIIEVFKDENAPDVLVDDVIRDFPYRSAQVLGVVFTLLLVGGALIIRRRMRPVAAVSRLADRIGPGTLDLRLPERDLPAEVQPIVHAVNGALARLERAADAQREFLGRAAHQLRTPLTVLGARVAQLDDSAPARELRRDVRELGRILTQLLQFNEIDALPLRAGDRADLAAVGEAVCEELREMAAKRKVALRLSRPDRRTLVGAEPNVIEVAVRNLVENAVQHSPPGTTVEIEAGAGEIVVSDAGPGVPEDRREAIFEPFWSGDARARRSGLGLAIVRRIAERSGAAVSVERGAAGGARFRLRFAEIYDGAESDARAIDRSIPASLAVRRRVGALGRAAS